MRILWLGNPPWVGSGYGEQAGLFIPRLQALGHEVAVATNWGLQGATFEWQGLTCYPADGDWGNQTIGIYAKDFNADLVIALCDAWVMKPPMWPEGTEMAIWAPVDHEPIPPAVFHVLSHERVRPLAMSRFGEQEMASRGLDPCYVPHGVDLEVFYPRREIRDDIRAELGIPKDAFLAGMVAANKGNPAIPRKGFPQAFQAFAKFAEKHDDAWLYVHTEAQPAGNGISLPRLSVATRCPEGRVMFTPEHVWKLGANRQVVAHIYQAFDVLLNPSMGEGFGIPVLEAQACGVPVIASDHSAMSELTQAGWLVTGDPWWDALQDAFFITPAMDSIVAALDAAYEAREDMELRASAVEFAAAYDADYVTETFWQPTLDKLSRPREAAPLNLNGYTPNRQLRRKLAKASR